jgi:CubicO group peptidase (beta-lactamase class C family)
MKKLFTFLFLTCIYTSSLSQGIDNVLKKKIDDLFVQWDNPKSPGGAVGIVINNSLVYAKGFGMADIEHNIAITPETVFYMASVSKQFTGYCMVLLAKQGKVNLDEDIRTYLPWFPDYGDHITVRNLLNHTSGIRDDINLAMISGLGRSGMLTQLHAVKLIKNQQSLNFKPGEQHQYSNSNFVLLAEIVEAVSGQSFSSFADSAIFKPLGMNQTFFQEDYTRLIPNKANSYSKVDSSTFSNNFQTIYTLGDGGLFSNVNDMKKWVSNYFTPEIGDSKDIQQLTQKGRLTNGNEIFYALGVNVTTLKGWDRFQHSGSLAGYRNYLAIYPDLKLGIIVFGNVSSNPSPRDMVVQLNDLLIKEKTSATNQMMLDDSAAVLADTAAVLKYCGHYLSNDGTEFRFVMRNKKLFWEAGENSNLLLKESDNRFIDSQDSTIRFVFSEIDHKKKSVTQYLSYTEHLFTSYPTDNKPTEEESLAYAGSYYSPELDCSFGIASKDGQFILTSIRHEDLKLTYLGKDELIHKGGLGHLQIIRNNQNKVVAFDLDNGSIKNLTFNKME